MRGADAGDRGDVLAGNLVGTVGAVTPANGSKTKTRPAHGRRRRWRDTERRLRELGSYAPSLPPDELHRLAREQARRVLRRAVATVVLVLVLGLAGLQWFRPIPSPVFDATVPATLSIPGGLPLLAWPGSGTAAVALAGAGTLASTTATGPTPMGSLAKLMAAYVVLQDHPLAPGASGPAIAVTAPAVAEYRAAVAAGQAVVAVVAGETLTELQALEAILVASGDNITALLADWDAGSVPTFVAKMNATAHRLGMEATTFLDPSGVAAGSVTTPGDMIRLAQAAMAVPSLAAVVAMQQVSLPTAGLVYNLNYDLARDGFVGIKAGADATAGGCFVFEAQQTVDGRSVTLVGALLGLRAPSPADDALNDADTLVKQAFAVLRPFTAVAAGAPVGRVVAPWGVSVPVTTAGAAAVVTWPALTVRLGVHTSPLARALAAGATVGTITGSLGVQTFHVPLRTTRRLAGPSIMWRLTRL
jgi:serine-type D-Ala-D-Ala carboxypeptidase (penicillin-binding protein 5/6)